MYAILVEDHIAETRRVLTALACETSSAAVVMMATANAWADLQQVDLGYIVQEDSHAHEVIVLAGDEIVFQCSIHPITSIVNAADIAAFIKELKPTEH